MPDQEPQEGVADDPQDDAQDTVVTEYYKAVAFQTEEEFLAFQRAMDSASRSGAEIHRASLLKILAEAIAQVGSQYNGSSETQPELAELLAKEARAQLRLITRSRLEAARENQGKEG